MQKCPWVRIKKSKIKCGPVVKYIALCGYAWGLNGVWVVQAIGLCVGFIQKVHLDFTSQWDCFLTSTSRSRRNRWGTPCPTPVAKIMSGTPENVCKINHYFLQKQEEIKADVGKSIENLPLDLRLLAGMDSERSVWEPAGMWPLCLKAALIMGEN